MHKARLFKILLTCLTGFTISLRAMNLQPNKLIRKEISDLECEKAASKKVKVDTEEVSSSETFSHFMGLPPELHVHIVMLIGDSPNFIEALNSIKSLACASKYFDRLLNDRTNIYCIFESLEKRLHRSISEIANTMNTATSKEIGYELLDKAQKKYFDFIASSAVSKTLYYYADFLLKISDQDEKKQIPNYLYYLYMTSANHNEIIYTIKKTITGLYGDQDFEQFKLWIDSGYFNKFPQDIARDIIVHGRVELLAYLIECGFDIRNIELFRDQSGPILYPVNYIEKMRLHEVSENYPPDIARGFIEYRESLSAKLELLKKQK